jgi:hypothetical protein
MFAYQAARSFDVDNTDIVSIIHPVYKHESITILSQFLAMLFPIY